jgi:hypothetical protein
MKITVNDLQHDTRKYLNFAKDEDVLVEDGKDTLFVISNAHLDKRKMLENLVGCLAGADSDDSESEI